MLLSIFIESFFAFPFCLISLSQNKIFISLSKCFLNNFMSPILTCGSFLHQFPNLGYWKRNLLNTSSMPLDGAPITPA
jgi:hypothetical protein